jgi:hypothetical protein
VHVEYHLTPDDLFAYHWRAYFKSSLLRRSPWKQMLILFVAFLLVALAPAAGPAGFQPDLVNWPFLAAFLPAAVLYRLIERWLVKRAIQRLVAREKPDRGQLGRHRLRLLEDGFLESTAVGESHTFWAGIDRVEQDESYIFIYTAAAAGHVIPKRAFEGNDADLFYQRVKSKAESAEVHHFGS